ncbi:hypothetical protein D3C71_1331120 [compost metagenome]
MSNLQLVLPMSFCLRRKLSFTQCPTKEEKTITLRADLASSTKDILRSLLTKLLLHPVKLSLARFKIGIVL